MISLNNINFFWNMDDFAIGEYIIVRVSSRGVHAWGTPKYFDL
jgi:hypothetical protein